MADQGIFPKSNGDVYYSEDANLTFGINNNFEQGIINATTSNGSFSFSTTRKRHLIHNRGSEDAYISFDSATVAGSNYVLGTQQRIEVFGPSDAVHARAVTGTTDVQIFSLSSTSEAASLSSDLLSVSTSSGSVSLATGTVYALITNTGYEPAYINFGSSATTDNLEISPRDTVNLSINNFDSISAITSSGTTELSIITSTVI